MAHLRWLQSLGSLGWEDGDSADVRLQKATVTFCTVLIVVAAVVWVGTYWALGLRVAAAIPLLYQVLSVAGLVVFRRTKRLAWLRNLQLSLMLILPFCLQWTLGGFVAASAVCLWALAAAMGSVMFGARPWVWFSGFLALLAVSAVVEPLLAPAPVPAGLRVAFFVLNVGTTSLVVFLLLSYSLRQRDAARAALAREHRALEAEREKSERLLLNVLPATVAARLKEGEAVIADAGDVSVLFADLLDFTPLSAHLAPRAVVALLNDVFSHLDELAGRFGLEKIKTHPGHRAGRGAAGRPLPLRAARRDRREGQGQDANLVSTGTARRPPGSGWRRPGGPRPEDGDRRERGGRHRFATTRRVTWAR